MQIMIRDINLPNNSEKVGTINRKFSTTDSLLFNIEVDADGKILNISSYIDMPEATYYKAAETAWSNKKDISQVTLDGKQWQYRSRYRSR